MKRLALFVIAMCLLLTACGVETEPETQETEVQKTETQESAETRKPSETQKPAETQESETSEPDIQEEITPVYTDWSKLTPYKEESVYSYYKPRSANGFLQPQDDYGVLLKYTGKVIGTFDKDIHLYGLVTADGRIVTEPVYRHIHFQGDFMILEKGKVQSSYSKEWNDTDDTFINNYTIAAPDGSWVRDIGLGHYTFACGDDFLIILKEDYSLITLNKDGDIVSEISDEVFRSYYGEEIKWNPPYPSMYNDARCLVYGKEDADELYLDATNGTVLNEMPEWYTPEEFHEYEYAVFQGYNYAIKVVDRITGKTYYFGEKADADRNDLMDEAGKVLFEDCYNAEVIDGLISKMRDDYFCYYSVETGELVFKYPIQRSNAE